MVVQHNITAMNSSRQLGIVTNQQAKQAEKLSSGFRINRAGDDAAGLKISEKMRSQIRGLQKASTNAQDGVSLIQTAEGALNEAHSILQRMNELAVQGANDTNEGIDRAAINEELTALTAELDRIAETTQFNKQNLLDGTFTGKRIHVGANVNQNISITITSMNAAAIGVGIAGTEATNAYYKAEGLANSRFNTSAAARTSAGEKWSADNATIGKEGQVDTRFFVAGMETSHVASGDARASLIDIAEAALNVVSVPAQAAQDPVGATVSTYSKANMTISMVQAAINNVSSQRSALGALQNRLEHTIANLDNVAENTQAAESRIRDTDMAAEMVDYSKNQILAQAGQSMLAQANQSTQGVLSLLQ